MAPGCQILSLYPSFANADACFYGIGMPGSLFSLANVAASFSTNKLLVVSIPSVPLLQMQQQAFGTGSLLSLTNSTASFSANKFPLSPSQNAVAWFWHRDKFSFSNPPLQIFLPLGWLFFHINSFSIPHSQIQQQASPHVSLQKAAANPSSSRMSVMCRLSFSQKK